MIHLTSTWFTKPITVAVTLFAGLAVGCGRGHSATTGAPPNAGASSEIREPAAIEKHEEGSVVRLSAAARQRATIAVVTVEPRSVIDVLSAPAELQLNGDRVAMVGPRVAGRVARIDVSMGDRIGAGTVLASIDSPDVGSLLASYTSAQAAESVAQRTYQREKDLFARRISAEREVLAAEAELARATSERRTVESRLQALDVALPQAGSSGPASALLPIRSPIQGTVIERNATIGAPVGPDAVLFKLADLSTLWLVAKVPETTMRDIRRGDTVMVNVDALPDQPVSGRVSYIGATVSETTRTVDVRIDVPNRTGQLKPGMFARAQLATRSAPERSDQLLIPQIAVQELNRKRVVFVPRSDGGFDVREVTIGVSVGDDIEILSGLKPRETVVTTGSFTLKSQAVRGEAGEPD
jgi:cobalt-zinc-cadmium efflux system membrane fusion protein